MLLIGKSESSKFWLGVLNGLKQQGVKDILIMCSDNLTGIKEASLTYFESWIRFTIYTNFFTHP